MKGGRQAGRQERERRKRKGARRLSRQGNPCQETRNSSPLIFSHTPLQLVRELTSTVLARPPKACNILEVADFRAVYRRYASLFFIVGIDGPTTTTTTTTATATATATSDALPGAPSTSATTSTTVTTPGDNELAALATAHLYVEVLDALFGSVCELDLVFNFHIAHHALDELVVGGLPVEPGRGAAARGVAAADAAVEAEKAGKLGLVEAALGAGEV